MKSDLKDKLYDQQWWCDQILIDKLDILSDPNSTEDEEKDEDIDNFMDEPHIQSETIEEYDGLNDNFEYFVLV